MNSCHLILLPIFFLCTFTIKSQDVKDLPYHTIPEVPEEFTASTMVARLVDGLGFRYYWATEGLTAEDLDYSPNEGNRTTLQTIEHLHGLTKTIHNTIMGRPNIRGGNEEKMDYDAMRSATLTMLMEASNHLKSDRSVTPEDMNIIFQRGDQITEMPFWNLINGPIADAIWHCGQIAIFRRLSGNPFNDKVNLFNGTVRE